MNSKFKRLGLIVHEFNIMPTRYIHYSWLKDIYDNKETIKMILGHPRSERKMAAMITKKFGIAPCYDFSDPLHSIALIEKRDLDKLIVFTGMAVYSSAINKMIKGHQIRELKCHLGKEAYRFSLEVAPLYMGDLHFDDMVLSKPTPTSASIKQGGRTCIALSLGGTWRPLFDRLRLRFPTRANMPFTDEISESERSNYRTIVRKILFNEVIPNWKDILL